MGRGKRDFYFEFLFQDVLSKIPGGQIYIVPSHDTLLSQFDVNIFSRDILIKERVSCFFLDSDRNKILLPTGWVGDFFEYLEYVKENFLKEQFQEFPKFESSTIMQKTRKIIQIESSNTPGTGSLYSLCDDGTIWEFYYGGEWRRVKDVPQGTLEVQNDS